MIIILIVSALFFAAAIICFVFAFSALLNHKSRKEHIFFGLIICAIFYTVICIFCFSRYIQQVQNKAIQDYINGDYELVDIIVDDKIVDSYYQLIEHD